MKIGFENFQKLLRANQELLASKSDNEKTNESLHKSKNSNEKQKPLDFSDDDNLVDNLQKMNKSRIQLGESLFGKKTEEPSVQNLSAEEIKPDLLALRTEVSEMKLLLKKISQQQADFKQILIRRSPGAAGDTLNR